MRKLKTPEEIVNKLGYHLSAHRQDLKEIILATQRDALECAVENAKLEVIEMPGAGSFMHRLVKSSILNLLP